MLNSFALSKLSEEKAIFLPEKRPWAWVCLDFCFSHDIHSKQTTICASSRKVLLCTSSLESVSRRSEMQPMTLFSTNVCLLAIRFAVLSILIENQYEPPIGIKIQPPQQLQRSEVLRKTTQGFRNRGRDFLWLGSSAFVKNCGRLGLLKEKKKEKKRRKKKRGKEKKHIHLSLFSLFLSLSLCFSLFLSHNRPPSFRTWPYCQNWQAWCIT